MKSTLSTLLCLPLFFVLASCSDSMKDAQTADTETQTDSTTRILLTEVPVGKSNYLISIPENYVLTENEGPDFYVYYINPSDSTDTLSFTAGMYFGNHPSKFKPLNDSCITDVMNGIILESNTDWTVYNCKGSYSAQTIADSKSDEGWNALVHAFGNGRSEADVHQVIDIFATLRKKK
ncbi:MAG: hypothetical protein WAQ28_18480 [Bacteroidia bacterium]|jgi:hypothetical protein